jgi:hypothetical protein
MSNKGINITAGIISFYHSEKPKYNQEFTLQLSKCQDANAYCECKIFYND